MPDTGYRMLDARYQIPDKMGTADLVFFIHSFNHSFPPDL